MATFDIFLSHNSADKDLVERIAEELQTKGVKPWLDKWCLVPGQPFQDQLANALKSCRTCGIFVGQNGIGDWAREELRLAQDHATKNSAFGLIPILLPGVPEPFDYSKLPPFLTQRTWVDFRRGFDEPRLLRKLIKAIEGLPPGPEGSGASEEQKCPYRGLETFDEEHAEFFFGRERDIQRVLEKLKGTRFLAVLGASGSGKSSLVRAGVIPALKEGALPQSDAWAIRVFTPGSHPLTTLGAQVLRLCPTEQAMQTTVDKMAEDERTLHLGVAFALVGQKAGHIALVIDQFEEVFTLCNDEKERTQFLANLLYASSIPDGRCTVLLTMRADFLPKCASYAELAARIAAQQFLVSPMDVEMLRQVINEPANRVGLTFEPGLVDTILTDVASEPGALPLLEHALLELWKRRDDHTLILESYRESGGVKGAIAKTAEDTFKLLSPDEQLIIRRIMLRLTRLGEGTEDTRRRALLTDLVRKPEEADAVNRITRLMADARLLITGRDAEHYVDVAHEALIRGWPRLRQWLGEDRAGLRLHHRISEAAQEWRRSEREEGMLYRGVRLTQAQEWRERNEAELNLLEREFLHASVALKQHLEQQEKERQQRELDTARKLAETERQRAEVESKARRRQRYLIFALIGLVVLAGLVAGIAVWQGISARAAENAARAANQRTRIAASQVHVSLAHFSTEVAGNDTQASAYLAKALKLDNHNYKASALIGAMLTRTSWPIPLFSFVPPSAPFHLEAPLQGAGQIPFLQPAQFSPDGRWLLTVAADGTARVWNATTGEAIGEPMKHRAAVYSAQFSPDGKRVLTASEDQTAQIWDAATGKAIGEPMKHQVAVYSAQFDADGQRIVTASGDGTARVWDATTGQEIGQPIHRSGPHSPPMFTSAQFSPDAGRVVTASNVDAQVWDSTTGEAIGEPMNAEGWVHSAQFSPEGERVVTASAGGTAQVWDATTGTAIGQRMKHQAAVYSAQFSPDGERVLTASEDGTARIWDAATGKALGEPMRHEVAANPTLTLPEVAHPFSGYPGTNVLISAHFNADGQRVVTASQETVRIWDATAREEISEPLGTEDGVRSAQFSPDGRWVLVIGRDTTVWDTTTGEKIGKPMKHQSPVNSARFSADSQHVVTVSEDNTARVWDAATGKAIGQPMKHESKVISAQFSPDGQKVVTISNDSTARLWDAATGRVIGQPMKHESKVNTAQFNANAQRILTVSSDGMARLWDAATGKPIGERMKQAGGEDPSAQFSPDGRTMLTVASMDPYEVRVWDAATGKAIGQPMRHESRLNTAQFNANGQRIVTASSLDGMVRLWDAATGKPIGELMKQSEGRQSTQFSPDGQRIVTASGDGIARLWDATTAKPMGELMKHMGLDSAQFSPDGQRIVTASADGLARLWDAATAKPIGELMNPPGGVGFAQFSPDGQRIVTLSGGGDSREARVWDALTGEAIGEPIEQDGGLYSARFSADCQRVLTESRKQTAMQVWALPITSSKDSPEEVSLLADLAEATCGVTLQASGETEFLAALPPEQVAATRQEIATKFAGQFSQLTPIERLLKWSASDPKSRTISPISELSIAQWVEHRIKEGTLESLRAAMLVDPANARLAAHFGWCLANAAFEEKGSEPDKARRARAEADFQVRRALKLDPDNDEVKTLYAVVTHLPDDAFRAYEEALKTFHQLEQKNPGTYLKELTETLDNLAKLRTWRAYEDALVVYRELAQKNPESCLPALARLLRDLGLLNSHQNRPEEALQAYEEALKIFHQLEQKNPGTYLEEVKVTLGYLNKLGTRQAYEDALEIYRELAQKSPESYLPDAVNTLHSLAAVDANENRLEEALQALEEALKILDELEQKNFVTYVIYEHALTVISYECNRLGGALGMFDSDQKRKEEARRAYQDGLKVYRKLAQINPKTYVPDVAETLHNLSVLDRDQKRLEEARKELEEALQIYESLAKQDNRFSPALTQVERLLDELPSTQGP